MLFPRADGVESSWKLVQPLLDYSARNDVTIDKYKAGSWGPKAFNRVIENDGRSWIEPSIDVCAI